MIPPLRGFITRRQTRATGLYGDGVKATNGRFRLLLLGASEGHTGNHDVKGHRSPPAGKGARPGSLRNQQGKGTLSRRLCSTIERLAEAGTSPAPSKVPNFDWGTWPKAQSYSKEDMGPESAEEAKDAGWVRSYRNPPRE